MQLLLNLIGSFVLYLLIAVSVLLYYSVIRFFIISHAFIISIGAYLFYSLNQLFPSSLIINIFFSILITATIGILCEHYLYRPLRRQNATPLSLLIASIGLYTILQNAISLAFGDDTKTLRTGEVKVGHELLGAYITDIQIATIVVSALLFIGLLLFQKYTLLGKSIRAVATNPELSTIYGIDADRVILWAVGIGSALGAVAGILSALDTNMTPTMGFNLLLYGVVAMIIGGVGSTKGLIGGALLVATAQHLAAYYIDTKWMDAVAYLILILFLIWKPLGFSGNRLKKIEI